jgi:phosphoglycerate dehydrogenase-like enzyme
LIGERELRAMKPTAFLLNPARGPIVQEEPLVRALREGWIAGAALDTHYYYPMPPEHPLWSMSNVIMTPHISGSDRGPHFVNRIWEIALHNIEAFQQGRPLWNELTPNEKPSAVRPHKVMIDTNRASTVLRCARSLEVKRFQSASHVLAAAVVSGMPSSHQ